MIEAEPGKDAPAEIPLVISGILQFSDAALRVYGHPDLLSIAAAIHGDDFVPQNEALIMKQPGLGAAFPWHQDGMTHWDSPHWDPEIHGFHFMVQLFGSTAANGLWYLPGSHRKGRADIKALVEQAGGNLLPDGVPLISKPGDVAVNNRQLVHASFPNTSKDVRMTLNLGFHRRAAVEGARGMSTDMKVERNYDAEAIRRRAEILGFAIDARRQRYPNERSFVYRPQIESGLQFVWSEASRASIKHYNRSDLLI
jgi:ectoine hydroxylase-related dioxygenase (phytanoyl-CoA dioxygenase family)